MVTYLRRGGAAGHVRWKREFYESDCQGQISPRTTASPFLQSAPNVICAGSRGWIAALCVAEIEAVFSARRFFWCEPWFYLRLGGLTLILVLRGGIELGKDLDFWSGHSR